MIFHLIVFLNKGKYTQNSNPRQLDMLMQPNISKAINQIDQLS